ncbi:DNA methyltransferase [Frigidibacter oleivorans]|uniref:DNA methyltransferase n=1 Tax=Frigidibacter oleivorans TaxID=2487129 RepID=UPI001F300B0D|nr:DNA methyltransferase [Frigidibacter oleivorans]
MSALASSSWPTALASDQDIHGTATASELARRSPGLSAIAGSWQTPRVSVGPYTRDHGNPEAERLTLQGQAIQWATPAAGLMNYDEPPETFAARGQALMQRGLPRQGINLGQQAQTWPTPAARDWKGENGADHLTNGTGRLHLDQLPNFVAHCFTPPVQRKWRSGVAPSIWRPISRQLFRWAMSSVSPTLRRRWLRLAAWRRRRLNAWFVEWLMGWPPGHALCACSATEFTRWQQDMRGALSRLPTASGPWIWEPPVERVAPVQMTLFEETL